MSDFLNAFVHGTFYPKDIREGDSIKASVFHNAVEYEVLLWSMSPMGVEFLWPFEESIAVGDKIDIIVSFLDSNLTFSSVSVGSLLSKDGRQIVGARWVSDSKSELNEQVREPRWVVNECFAPTVMCANPILFDQIMIFRVGNLSKGGAMLYTSMRNKVIIPGMTLNGTWAFPMIGSSNQAFEVSWVKVVQYLGIDQLSLGVLFKHGSGAIADLAGEYLLQFSVDASLVDFKKSGFKIKEVGKGLTIDFAKSASDYDEVIQLRNLAYRSYSDSEMSEMTDHFDTRARILTARQRGKIIGTCRLIFHDSNDILEVGQYLKLPADFPKNHELVEVSRFAVHPDYQSSSVVTELLKHMFMIMLQTKRRFLIASTPEHLVAGYKKSGFTIFKDNYFSPKSVADLRLYLMTLDLYYILSHPEELEPKVWARLYHELLQFALKRKLIEIGTLKKMHLGYVRMRNLLMGNSTD